MMLYRSHLQTRRHVKILLIVLKAALYGWWITRNIYLLKKTDIILKRLLQIVSGATIAIPPSSMINVELFV